MYIYIDINPDINAEIVLDVVWSLMIEFVIEQNKNLEFLQEVIVEVV